MRSVIGRFLEHSRIFYFAAGHKTRAGGEFFLGSADWMRRNLSTRIEVVTSVVSPPLKQRLWSVLDAMLQDRRQAWILSQDGKYQLPQLSVAEDGSEARGTYEILMELARSNAIGA